MQNAKHRTNVRCETGSPVKAVLKTIYHTILSANIYGNSSNIKAIRKIEPHITVGWLASYSMYVSSLMNKHKAGNMTDSSLRDILLSPPPLHPTQYSEQSPTSFFCVPALIRPVHNVLFAVFFKSTSTVNFECTQQELNLNLPL